MSDQSNPAVLNLFLKHPRSVGETYFQHMWFAASFAFWLIVAGLAALVHAVIPALCETTASQIIRRLHARIENRGATGQD
ncbi:DUF6356 family protein [Pseudaestuariivita rosea]|uniref:DUF6356 family protein n=1 Tax=Pseudaestuariivita rosea TaxID=2763263 RepID=UPI001ABB410E|nr:DUF6356 family protein [Pseudaestuariivita rosea]